MTPEQIQIVVNEIERRWRSRTPPQSVYDVSPGSRVNRSEIVTFCIDQGFGPPPILDDEYDKAIFALFAKLKKEFPNEQWDKDNAATRQRKKELL